MLDFPPADWSGSYFPFKAHCWLAGRESFNPHTSPAPGPGSFGSTKFLNITKNIIMYTLQIITFAATSLDKKQLEIIIFVI